MDPDACLGRLSGNDAPLYQVIEACRVCGGGDLRDVLDFGLAPLADRLLETENPGAPEPRVPLTLCLCPVCGLLQIRETVDPRVLFDDSYPYLASTSSSWVAHCRANAHELIEAVPLDRDSLVVEIASNDGYMLRHFQERGIPVLGFEPAGAPARAARARDIPTEQAFFTESAAESLPRKADLIVANNVLAHVADLHDLMRGIERLLKPGGTLVAEVPYAGDLVAGCEFDTIYHQHLCYFALGPLQRLFDRHGLCIRDIRRLSTHGGSVRLYAKRQGRPSVAVRSLLAHERDSSLLDLATCLRFAGRAAAIREELVAMLERTRRNGNRVAAYAAAAKGTALLHYCGIDSSVIDYVVDRNVYKQGKYLPGSRLAIHPPEKLLRDRPEFVLLLAWNLRGEILEQLGGYLAAGGRVIVPLPVPEIVSRGGAG